MTNEKSSLLQAVVNGISRALCREFEPQEALPERFRQLLAELEAKIRRNEK